MVYDVAEARLKKVLSNDPGVRVIRHAGYEIAKVTVKANNLDLDRRLSS